MNNYANFIKTKRIILSPSGKDPATPMCPALFEWQQDVVRWALRRGRSCIFADCGMGKTLMQLEWARQVGGRVLILAPLAVATQTVDEGRGSASKPATCAQTTDSPASS